MALRGMRPVLALATALSLAAAGCGGCGEEVDPTDGEGYPPLDPAVEAMLGAFCDYNERCPSDYYAIAYRDRTECMHIFNFILTCRLHSDEDEYDNNIFWVEERQFPNAAGEIQACADWLSTASCEALDGEGDGPCMILGSMFADDPRLDVRRR